MQPPPASLSRAIAPGALSRAIDKTHLRSTRAITSYLQQSDPTITTEQVEAINSTRPKDSYRHDKRRYYYPIFANHQHSYQMDLLEQSAQRPPDYPPYYLVLLNVNTRYGHAIPIMNKSKEAINDAITTFIATTPVKSIVSDDEPAFTSKLVLDTLTSNGISLRIITDHRHTALGLIDRFIRSLRDMNTPTPKSQHQSDHPKYRDFSTRRMAKLLDIYNHTVHFATGHTPQQMSDDDQLEKEYIARRLYDRERRRMQVDFELQPGTFVRYILPKEPHVKRRYRVSPEAYKISHRDGNAYVLIARDGTVKTVSRWQIVPIGDTLPSTLKFANTFGNNNGTVQEILDYYPQSRRYKVLFSNPDGTTFEDTIHESFLRGALPQVQSTIEKEYHQRHAATTSAPRRRRRRRQQSRSHRRE